MEIKPKLDREKLEKVCKEMGYNIEFDSDTPGIVSATGKLIMFDEIPKVYDVFEPIKKD